MTTPGARRVGSDGRLRRTATWRGNANLYLLSIARRWPGDRETISPCRGSIRQHPVGSRARMQSCRSPKGDRRNGGDALGENELIAVEVPGAARGLAVLVVLRLRIAVVVQPDAMSVLHRSDGIAMGHVGVRRPQRRKDTDSEEQEAGECLAHRVRSYHTPSPRRGPRCRDNARRGAPAEGRRRRSWETRLPPARHPRGTRRGAVPVRLRRPT